MHIFSLIEKRKQECALTCYLWFNFYLQYICTNMLYMCDLRTILMLHNHEEIMFVHTNTKELAGGKYTALSG